MRGSSGRGVGPRRAERLARAAALALAAVVAPVLPAAAQAGGAAVSGADAGFDVDRYRWRARLLVLLAPSPAHAALTRQLAALADERAALGAREIVVVSAFEDGSGVADGRALSPRAVAQLRRRFGARPGAFAALLVGKDGGVKLRRAEPVAPGDLFALVDGMPMGRDEAAARRRGPGG
jgi:hypothetical protein